MTSVIVKAVDVLRCEDDRCEILRGHDILIAGTRIDQVVPTNDELGAESVVDGRGMLALAIWSG